VPRAQIVIENPILNSPYGEPGRHFRFDDDGITDEIVDSRRVSSYFIPIPQAKKRSGQLAFDEWTGDRISENAFINRIRGKIGIWRAGGWQGVTATSRSLLEYWTGPDRERPLFFCQIEALETAIYITEVARKFGDAWIENDLRRFAEDANPGLFRMAQKMATGTGKTVVMAMLIAWHTLNKATNPQDGRFSDAFLVVAPGITIRDRLRVLLPSDPENYYRVRDLVPPDRSADLGRARVHIVNFHQFRLREKLKAPKLTKELAGQAPGVFTETPDEMVRRVTRALGTKRNIIVMNDEAHHCYRRRVGDGAELPALTGEDKREAAQRDEEARIWLSGLEAVAAKTGIRAVYDLSATPFYLRGSGWPEGTLFQWVVSDFSLIDAIEAGLVKIPRVPVDDNAEKGASMPTYRGLWLRIRNDLPKKGRRASQDEWREPKLPGPLEGALHSLYGNYEKAFGHWEEVAGDGGGAGPPVFIVVCNNTTVSKLVFDYVAGWQKILPDGSQVVVPGQLEHFSNEHAGAWSVRPKTILVDSSQLDSGEAMSAEFKIAAAHQIAEFKAERAQRSGQDVEDVSDEDLLREVMNTVGKPGKLGGDVRCVVSVSMLTEGWDANTVTHVLGVRAFGTQLLCEQVVGRGLRRRSYVLGEDGVHFEPEYAEVYGVPFSFIPASGSSLDPKPTKIPTRVRAIEDRAAHCEIEFPRVVGYRWDTPDDHLTPDFTEESRIVLDSRHIPTRTEMAAVVGETEEHRLDYFEAMRAQQVAFMLAKRLLDKRFRTPPAEDGQPEGERPWLFPRLVEITKAWLADPSQVVLKDDAFPGLLAMHQNADEAVEKLHQAFIVSQGPEARLTPILSPADPIGSTRYVDFDTTKDVYLTDSGRCHVSHVACDSEWESTLAGKLEHMPAVHSYVKNQGLGFTVAYTIDGQQRSYIPDFIVRVDDGFGPADLLSLVVEVSGQRRKDKDAKTATMRNLWVPAVNNWGRLGRWAFVEVTDPWEAAGLIELAVSRRPVAVGS
jgi:type III restriction enzyme